MANEEPLAGCGFLSRPRARLPGRPGSWRPSCSAGHEADARSDQFSHAVAALLALTAVDSYAATASVDPSARRGRRP